MKHDPRQRRRMTLQSFIKTMSTPWHKRRQYLLPFDRFIDVVCSQWRCLLPCPRHWSELWRRWYPYTTRTTMKQRDRPFSVRIQWTWRRPLNESIDVYRCQLEVYLQRMIGSQETIFRKCKGEKISLITLLTKSPASQCDTFRTTGVLNDDKSSLCITFGNTDRSFGGF